MGTPYEIPLSPQAQLFNIALAGVTYKMRVTWCAPGPCWLLDLSDVAGNPIVAGLPLVAGTDLLGQLAYLGIGGSIVVQNTANIALDPSLTDLGINSLVFFILPTSTASGVAATLIVSEGGAIILESGGGYITLESGGRILLE